MGEYVASRKCICKWCGETFYFRSTATETPEYCSTECRETAQIVRVKEQTICPECGKPFVKRRKMIFCSPECRKNYAKGVAQCECGRYFVFYKETPMKLCPVCRKSGRRKNWTPTKSEQAKIDRYIEKQQLSQDIFKCAKAKGITYGQASMMTNPKRPDGSPIYDPFCLPKGAVK